VIERASWVPEGIVDTIPSPARIYDYLLGGAHNFAVDREMIDRVVAIAPQVGRWALLNRAFLRRAVLTLVDAGVRQFLDIGSGIPTVGNVHEIAQQADPEARVVYVDNDPVAIAHSQLVLDGNDRATAILADMRDPEGILGHPETRRMLDFDAPIGLLMVTVFHYISDLDGPIDLLARYCEPLVPGSHLALSHICSELNPGQVRSMVDLVKNSPHPFYPRTRTAITRLFSGFDLLDPGLVPTSEWWIDATPADGDPSDDPVLAGVGVKR
jgi:hypothetical protein